MRKLTHYLVWLFVFSVPWEFVALPGFGAVSRLFGAAAIGVGVMTCVMNGRFRRPGAVVWAAIAFTAWSFLSLTWTVSDADTAQRVSTYAQLLASLWLVSEFATTPRERQSLMFAFCLGEYVPVADLLKNYAAGVEVAGGSRYTATGLNADDMGLTLVLGIPIAWHLMLTRKGAVRLISGIYCPVALVGMLLTGTRGAFLAAIVALAIVPLTTRFNSTRSGVLAVAVLIAAAISLKILVPSESWERMLSIRSEIAGGTMTGRLSIWRAGLEVFQDRPVLGFGAGAFGTAVAVLIPEDRMRYAHNAAVAVLVEQGVIGLFLFTTVLVTCAWTIVRLPQPQRTLWAVLMCAWLVGVMSLNWDYRKLTWLLFGLLAAQRPLGHPRFAKARRHLLLRHLRTTPPAATHAITAVLPR